MAEDFLTSHSFEYSIPKGEPIDETKIVFPDSMHSDVLRLYSDIDSRTTNFRCYRYTNQHIVPTRDRHSSHANRDSNGFLSSDRNVDGNTLRLRNDEPISIQHGSSNRGKPGSSSDC